jgi:hypothetical protein
MAIEEKEDTLPPYGVSVKKFMVWDKMFAPRWEKDKNDEDCVTFGEEVPQVYVDTYLALHGVRESKAPFSARESYQKKCREQHEPFFTDYYTGMSFADLMDKYGHVMGLQIRWLFSYGDPREQENNNNPSSESGDNDV